jgi:hypothetical protein
MALEGQGHMATIDTMTEALYKRVQAMGGNFPTDDEIESAVGGKDYVKVSDELTESIKDGDLVIGGGGSGGGSNTVYVDLSDSEEGYISNLTGKEIIDACNDGKTLVARRGYENSSTDYAWTYFPLLSAQFYRGNFSIIFVGVIVSVDPSDPLTVRSFNANVPYTDDQVIFNQVEKLVE